MSDDFNPWGDGPTNNSKPTLKNRRNTGGKKPNNVVKLKNPFDGKSPIKAYGILGVGLLLFWVIINSFYMVDIQEEAIVLRFGKYHRTTSSGLHFKFPRPIERVEKLPVTRENRVEIGFSSISRRGNTYQTKKQQESYMLTGDENIVDINFVVSWNIKSAKDFLFNVRDSGDYVKSTAESAMREVISRTPIDNALTDGKPQIAAEAKELLQDILDNYGAGINVLRLEIKDANPPKPVLEAFIDVQNAKTEKERAKNQAEAYRNDVIPRARGQAAQMLEDSKAYKQRVIAEAEGAASRFNAVYNEYSKAKRVTKDRIYLETMEQVLGGMNKVIIDKQAGAVPYLPLPAIQNK